MSATVDAHSCLSFVALITRRDLLFCAKHLFVAPLADDLHVVLQLDRAALRKRGLPLARRGSGFFPAGNGARANMTGRFKSAQLTRKRRQPTALPPRAWRVVAASGPWAAHRTASAFSAARGGPLLAMWCVPID